MREIQRVIVSAIIFSKDGKVLMGRKDPSKGGVYSDYWHIPGGGVDQGETLKHALTREVKEEVGIDIRPYSIVSVPIIDTGEQRKSSKIQEREFYVTCSLFVSKFTSTTKMLIKYHCI